MHRISNEISKCCPSDPLKLTNLNKTGYACVEHPSKHALHGMHYPHSNHGNDLLIKWPDWASAANINPTLLTI